MKKRVKNALLYAGLERDQFEEIRSIWYQSNRRSLLVYSSISLSIFILIIIANLFIEDGTAVNLRNYIYMAVFHAVIWILNFFCTRERPDMSIWLNITFICSLFYFGLRITFLHPDMPSVIMVTMLMSTPFLYTDRPYRMILMVTAAAATLCALSFRLKPPAVADLDAWNSFAISVVTIAIIVYYMHERFIRIYQSLRIEYLSRTDVLTGTRNRNSYEARLDEYAVQCPELVCIFVDVNGLHELNNTRGHLAGDRMLQAVAVELINCFGGESVYRIGGDEFVCFDLERSEEEIMTGMQEISGRLSAQGYAISVGIVAGPGPMGKSIAGIVKEAEDEMYLAKTQYYQNTGKDRRRRR